MLQQFVYALSPLTFLKIQPWQRHSPPFDLGLRHTFVQNLATERRRQYCTQKCNSRVWKAELLGTKRILQTARHLANICELPESPPFAEVWLLRAPEQQVRWIPSVPKTAYFDQQTARLLDKKPGCSESYGLGPGLIRWLATDEANRVPYWLPGPTLKW